MAKAKEITRAKGVNALVLRLQKSKDRAEKRRIRRQLRKLNHYQGGDTHRHCDERCWSATGKDCDCKCGGKNHGLGHAPRSARKRK
jgi:hypothetical protein